MTDAHRRSTTGECDRVRQVLWPLDAPRACVEGEEEARAHLESCPACREFFELDAAVGRALRETRLREHAPHALRERVFDALARERARPTASPAGTVARTAAWLDRLPISRAAVVAALAAALLAGLLLFPGNPDSGSAFAQDYLSRAVQQRRVERADSAEIARFFLHEFGQRIEPRRLADARIAGAMICLIEGRRAAMVEYTADGSVLSHYRIPVRTGPGRRVLGVRAESAGGVQAVRWSDDRFEHALVAELPAGELERIARSRFGAR